jgi:hypothetical protein
MWFKSHLPFLKENSKINYQTNKKLKQDIANGIPVPVRGHAWIAMVGNKLRITPYMFNVFKDMS